MSTQLRTLNQSNPNGIVTAPQDSIFTREGDKFYLMAYGQERELPVSKKSFALPYKSEIWYPTLTEESITFKNANESWIKLNGDGKTGWSLLSNKTTFAKQVGVKSLLENSSFEYGLNGWTVLFETGSDGDVFTYSGSINYPYEGAFAPPSGDHAVITDQGGPTTSVLYQDFVVPNTVNRATISFYYAVLNDAEFWAVGPDLHFVGLGGPPLNQYARIDIMSPDADPLGVDGILVNLYKTQESDPLFSDYQLVSFDITSYLRSCTGETMRFRAAQVDNMNPLLFGLDDVSLIIT